MHLKKRSIQSSIENNIDLIQDKNETTTNTVKQRSNKMYHGELACLYNVLFYYIFNIIKFK